jgi:hypothetical protein
MYTSSVYAQDGITGRVGVVLDAIADAANMVHYNKIDTAVAYATRRGVQLIANRLTSPGWESSIKRFLVSIDFGITEPGALAALVALPNADLRVPNGLATLANEHLMPPQTFHTKAYMFLADGYEVPMAVAVGSANISVSALATGAEAVVVQAWDEELTRGELALLRGARPLVDWFEDAWNLADPVSAVLPAYESRFDGKRKPESLRDDETPAAEIYSAPAAAVEIAGTLAVQLATAQSLWVKCDTLYHNLGAGRAGNQLDTPRGTRIFFGFPAKNVARNTVLGQVEIMVPGYAPVARSVRFGNNMMDKINLPLPGEDGPSSYDNAYLIFDRVGTGSTGMPLFKLTVADLAQLNSRKSSARNRIDLNMTGGRPYGLLF